MGGRERERENRLCDDTTVFLLYKLSRTVLSVLDSNSRFQHVPVLNDFLWRQPFRDRYMLILLGYVAERKAYTELTATCLYALVNRWPHEVSARLLATRQAVAQAQ